jgi:protein SCO1/2
MARGAVRCGRRSAPRVRCGGMPSVLLGTLLGASLYGLTAIGSPLAAAEPPADAEALAFREHPGTALPEGVSLTDSDGAPRALRQLSGGLPLIVVLGYFHCPNLCGVVRDSLYQAAVHAGLAAGHDYALAAISIDPAEGAQQAAAAKAADLARYQGLGDARFIHYLTGGERSIRAVSEAVGFRDRRDSGNGEFLHPAGIIIATPDGRISRYLLGVGYRPTQLREALAGARRLDIAPNDAMRVLLLCFHYDPATGRYSLEILKLLRLGAVLTVLTVAGTMYLMSRRERHPA